MRIEKLKAKMLTENIDSLLITDMKNIFYLTGFSGTAGTVFLTAKRNIFMTDSRYSEMARGLISDFEIIETRDPISLLTDLSAKDLLENFAKIEEIIYRSCEVKRKVVVDDELDNGVRLYLNFGHTIGHAVENTAGYGKVMHGEAVAIGMVQISKIAEKKGLMPLGITDEIRKMVKKYGLPDDYQPWDEALLFKALTHDKKARGTIIKTVIVPEIGTAKINEVTFEEMKDYLKK